MVLAYLPRTSSMFMAYLRTACSMLLDGSEFDDIRDEFDDMQHEVCLETTRMEAVTARTTTSFFRILVNHELLLGLSSFFRIAIEGFCRPKWRARGLLLEVDPYLGTVDACVTTIVLEEEGVVESIADTPHIICNVTRMRGTRTAIL